MSIKKSNDKDIFENVIDIGLRMYGNGHSYPSCTVDYITEYCRQQIRDYFIKHNQLINNNNNNNRVLFLNTLVYNLRHKKISLKRLQQYVQAKDRPTSQQEELVNNIVHDKKITMNHRFIRICHQMNIHINDNQ